MIAFLVYVEDFVVGFHEGFIRPTCKVEGYTSRKFIVFLFASMVILRPFALKMSLTSCFVFSICLGVALHTANSSSLSRNKKRERARTALRSHARYHSYPIPQHNYFEVSSSYFF